MSQICCNFFINLLAFVLALTSVWTIAVNSFNPECLRFHNRVCNDRGTCDMFRSCVCDPLFSGTACEHQQIAGMLLSTNRPCNGMGNVTLAGGYVFPECRVVTNYLGRPRPDTGWNSQSCRNRIRVARSRVYVLETATAEDYLGLPMCLCRPPFGGVACEDLCPTRDDDVVCSGVGNKTVGFVRNGTTTGIGCQCTKPMRIMDALPYLNADQKMAVANDLDTFARGLCARLIKITAGDESSYVVVPDVPYRCHCDAKHYGTYCEFGVCPEDPITDRMCSGHGHDRLGFGAEENSTRAVGAFGDPGKIHCVVGYDGCCVENQKLCSTRELSCPADRPFRCSSSGHCVGYQRVSRCDLDWEYGYWDDPEKAPIVPGDVNGTMESSPLAGFKFRIRGTGEFIFHYGMDEHRWDGTTEFWTKTMGETIHDVERRSFDTMYRVRVRASEDGLVEFSPAPFRNGDTNPDAMVRVVNDYGRYVVIDVATSRAQFDEAGGDYVANVTADSYLRPGGSIVDTAACLDDLLSCVWGMNFMSIDGRFRLCQRNGVLWSTTASRCDFPTVALRRVTTVAYGRPRVGGFKWDEYDTWSLQGFVGPRRTIRARVQASSGIQWSGGYHTVDSLRRPCVCEPSGVNASTWNTKWMVEFNRPPGRQIGQHVVALVESFGDARTVRGIVTAPGFILDEYGQVEMTSRTKALSREEYERGRPDPVDFVHPARCPDGRGAVMRTIPMRRTNSTNCRMERGRITSCDNGCRCDGAGCDCPTEHEAETGLSGLIDDITGECWSTRINGTVQYSITRTDNETCFLAESFASPMEFLHADGIRARLAKGVWVDLEVEIEGNVSRPVVSDFQLPFDEWCVGGSNASVLFGPQGFNAFRTTNFTVTSSEHWDDRLEVMWNDATTWNTTDAGWYRVDFAKPVHLVDLYVTFETIGLYVDANMSLNVSVAVQFGIGNDVGDDDRTDWRYHASFVGNAVNGSATLLMPMNDYVSTFRLLSRFPMSIRRLVPVTDQYCDLGVLTSGGIYPEEIIKKSLVPRRLNSSQPCFTTDTCVLNGIKAGNDGVCSDMKAQSWGVPPTMIREIVVDLTPTEVVAIFQPGMINVTTYGCLSSGCCNWGIGELPIPSSCNKTLMWDGGNVTTGFSENTTLGHFVLTKSTPSWGDLVSGVTACVDGTDAADCGPSNRLDRTNVGLKCGETELERRYRTRSVSLHDFMARASIDELLDMGYTLDFRVAYERSWVKFTRGPCGDCDGKTRCLDGTCSDDGVCPVAYYRLPGNGCVALDGMRREYKCACEVGWSGFECSKDFCVPIDSKTGDGDPHAWCACGGRLAQSFPPIKVMPPFSSNKKKDGWTTRELLLINRRRPRKTDREHLGIIDGGWEKLKATYKPFGHAISRQIKVGGIKRFTNCFFYKRLPNGRYVNRDDCVEESSTEYPFEAIKWKEWDVGNGSKVQYVWGPPLYEAKWDEAPIRCSSGSACVARESECYRNDLVNPPCGGDGTCRADGTCECDMGKETFVLTDRVSSAVSIPYASVNGVSDPTASNVDDPIWYGSAVCAARNCSAQDCSPPYACFPGTRVLGFADKLTVCEVDSGHGGRCAVDRTACFEGGKGVSEPLLCGGNGILRKVDYRNEWRCVCGSPRSPLIKDATSLRETSELIPNGFGGPRCDQYHCTEDKNKIWIERTDPRTNAAHVGGDGLPIPFKWMGPCGVPVGPRYEDLSLWKRCCPGMKRLDKCPFVPCGKGVGDTKLYSCQLAENCLDSISEPLVYVCNGHGKALADGTCECDRTETEGYTYDLSVLSYQGCFKRSQCALSQSNGVMCNMKEDCGDLKTWSEIPKLDYMQQWWPSLAYHAGLPPTNQTFVDLIFRDDRAIALEYVVSQLGQGIEDERANAMNTICRYPYDDPNSPIGMFPFNPNETCLYGDGFDSPSLLNPQWGEPKLIDGLFGEGSVNGDYVRIIRTQSNSQSLMGWFDQSTEVYAIRLHARKGVVAANIKTVLRFHGSRGLVCGDVTINSATFDWIGDTQNVLYCLPEYDPIDFSKILEQQNAFVTFCRPDESSAECIKWKDQTCLASGYVINEPGKSVFPGCRTSRCCAPRTGSFEPTGYLRIELIQVNNAISWWVDVDEIQVYARSTVVKPTPIPLMREIVYRYGVNTTCRDDQFMRSVFGQPLEFYKPRLWESASIPPPMGALDYLSAENACAQTGGVLASDRGFSDGVGYAGPMGKACFKSETTGAQVSGDDTGCLVSARDRNEIQSPNSTDLFEASCTTWGCHTPNVDVDYFSTPRKDLEGLQWKSEWAEGHMRLDDAVYDVVEEERRQKALVILPNQRFPLLAQHDTIHWRRLPRDFITSLPLSVRSSTDKAITKYMYTPEIKSGIPFQYRPKAEVMLYRRRLTRPSKVSVWTNPKTCVITVYSKPMCGRIAFNKRSPRPTRTPLYDDSYDPTAYQGNPLFGYYDYYHTYWYPEVALVNRGVRKTFLVTPSDDYGVLDMSNLIGNYDECAEDGGTSCPDIGMLIKGNVASISIQGPCIIEVTYGSAYHGENFQVDYMYGNRVEPTLGHSNYERRGVGGSTDADGIWPEGCNPMYLHHQAPYAPIGWLPDNFDQTQLYGNGLEPDFIQTPFAVTVDPTFTDTYGPLQDSFPPGVLVIEYLSGGVDYITNVLMKRLANLVMSGGFLFSGLVVETGAIRVMAKFTTRKIDLDYRACSKQTEPVNENDYTLGYEDHPYMCTNVRAIQTKRVYAGVRYPNKTTIDLSPKEPVRIRRQNQLVWMTRYNTTSSNQTGRMEYGRGEYRFNLSSTSIPMETNPDEVDFTLEELRRGTLLMQRRMLQQRVRFDYPRYGNDPIESIYASLDTLAEFRLKGRGLNITLIDDDELEGGSKLENSTVVFPYTSCRILGRDVKRCNRCPIVKTSDWEWHQRFLNPENLRFQASVTAVGQGITGMGVITVPKLYASWSSTAFGLKSYMELASMEYSFPKAYARLMSTFIVPDYHRVVVDVFNPAYYYDSCLKVIRNTYADGGESQTFSFVPTICELPAHKAVCIRDTKGYTIQSGCQCDACGPNTRRTPLQPGATAFTLFPKAVRGNYPDEYAVYDAWLAGKTSELISSGELPVNEIVAYVQALPQSFIGSFPGFYSAFFAGKSTRDGHLSRGAVSDAVAPIDFAFKSWFPVSCGVVYSRFTGVGRPMCARAKEFCDRDAVFPIIPMALPDIPSLLSSVGPDVDVRVEPRCGRYVSPLHLVSETEDDSPPPNEGDYVVLDSHEDFVVIKALKTSGWFRNSRRDLGTSKNGSVITGDVSCSNTCEIDIVVTNTHPKFLNPSYQLVVGTIVGGEYRFTVSTTEWRTMAWRFRAPRDTTIRLSRALITDHDSIAGCRTSGVGKPFVEVAPNVDSPAPQHRCVFTAIESQKYDDAEVGTCWCSPASPFGGPTCEWPATVSKFGKRICNTHPNTRYAKSKALTPSGELVDANEFGVFKDVEEFGCKRRSDVGSIMKTRLIPNAIGDHRYVVKGLNPPNQNEFLVVSATELRAYGFTSPTKGDDVVGACDAFSGALPSFTTGDEFDAYRELKLTQVFIDATLDRNGDVRWGRRSEVLAHCGGKMCPNATFVDDPCSTDLPICRAINYNNLAFNSSSGDSLVDGRNVSYKMNSNFQVNLTRTMPGGVTLEMIPRGISTSFTVIPSCPLCDATPCILLDSGIHLCDGDDIKSLKLEHIDHVMSNVTEIGVYWWEDSARFYMFMT